MGESLKKLFTFLCVTNGLLSRTISQIILKSNCINTYQGNDQLASPLQISIYSGTVLRYSLFTLSVSIFRVRFAGVPTEIKPFKVIDSCPSVCKMSPSFLTPLWISKQTWPIERKSYDKSPFTHRKIQKATWQHKNATKNFDYTTLADQLRTVILDNDSHQTSAVNPIYGILTFPLTTNCVIKRTYI